MKRISRRKFVAASAAAGISTLFITNPRVWGANEDVRVAVVGFGGRGKDHIGEFGGKVNGSRLTALCDVDSRILGQGVEAQKKKKTEVESYTDIRKLLESKDVDAIAVATPNHWHSLATIWACQAGKDVYVEKPISHNIWEGRKCVEAAKKYNRVVQHGTQRRSDESWYEAFDMIKKGDIGAVQWVKGFCYKPRGSIGKTSGAQQIPDSVDYDLWCGPAPQTDLRRKTLKYDWHWVWETGNGDIGNQGVHEMDLCRWFLGNKDLPERIMSIGGRFGYDDDATTPNTLIAYYDYKPVPFIFEVRGLPTRAKKQGDQGNPPMDAFGKLIRVGMWVQCENGYFAAGEGGGSLYDKEGKRIKQFTQNWKTGSHQQNFITAVKSRNPADNKCDAEVAHLSSALCHMGNIPYRVGKEMLAGEITETIKSNTQAGESFERMKDHLAKNEVDLAKTKIVYGPSLQFDNKTEKFVGELSAEANKYVSREYRAPFVVPENV